VKSSKKLIGTDDKSNISNYKYTNLVEICPLCKDDLVYLPKKVARSMGNISRCVLVKNISNLIHFLDPLTGQSANMSSDVFWRQPFRPIVVAGRSRLTRYIVLGKEAVALEALQNRQQRRNASHPRASSKQRNKVALVTVAKEDDLGVIDTQIVQTSCIGYLLKSGDVAVGYDLKETQLVDDEAEAARDAGELPDVIMCRKLYGGAALSEQEKDTNKKRMWTLQRLDIDVAEALKSRSARKGKEQEVDDMDEEDFLREVEADKEMRVKMHLYKAKEEETTKTSMDEDDVASNTNIDDEDDEDDQQVKLDELLDGLALNAGPDKNNTDMKDGEKWDPEELLAEGERAEQDGLAFVGRDESRNVREKDAAMAVTGNSFGVDFASKNNFNFK
jgi:nonsense-mediated mRNA decay protein 3